MLIKRAICLFIASVILFADSGFMIYAHTCLKSKHTSVSLLKAFNCCGKTEQKKSCCHKNNLNSCTVEKPNCCSVSAKYMKLCSPSTGKLHQPVLLLPLFSPVSNLFFTAPMLVPLSGSLRAHSPPLPKQGTEQSFTQIFRC